MMQIPVTFPVTCHTDFVGPGSTFVAIKGMQADGVDYIRLALEKGATTIVVQESAEITQELLEEIQSKSTLIRVFDARQALALLSAQALDFPAQKLKIVGITGTKGKTSTAFLIEHILKAAGFRTALLSTVHNKILDQIFPTNLTTQHPDYLHVFFNECVKRNIDYVVMEVAAQAHTLHRVHGITFDCFVFTNFDAEHAEFYVSLQEYFQAKYELLQQTKEGMPIIVNRDNEWSKKIIRNRDNCVTIRKNKKATYQFSFRTLQQMSEITIQYNNKSITGTVPLLGEFNCYNITSAFAACHQLGVSATTIMQALAVFLGVPGRFERYQLPNGVLCIIDYAHNPSSYQSVLSTLRTFTHHLIVVCGAGGDRDKSKRPCMAALATEFADNVIFTSDNPRSEDPKAIIQDMVVGVATENTHKYLIELDRECAIKKAYTLAQEGSIIALLGKGPDHYQIIKNEKIYFNEVEIVQQLGKQL